MYKDKMYLFGGINGAVDSNEQFFTLDMKTFTWHLLNPQPKNGDPENMCLSRDEHAAFLMGESMVVVGGFKEGERSIEVFQYSFEKNTWELIKAATG